MRFLLIIPIVFVLAHAWLAWTARSRRAPEIEATIAAHERLAAAMSPQPATSRRSARAASRSPESSAGKPTVDAR